MTDRKSEVAVVTGAGRGIGAAVAARLGSDGYRVALLDRSSEVLETAEALGGEAVGIVCDVLSAAAIEEAVATVTRSWGAIDVLVNNAGITRDGAIQDMTEDDWDAVVDISLKGTFLVTRAVVAAMQGGARIVNFSSIASLGGLDQVNYSAAKAGVRGLTRALAKELGPRGIRVNAVAPGFIITDMSNRGAERMGLPVEEFRARAAAQTPLRRVGTPSDVASVVSFLCGDDAAFVTGQTIFVDGGWVL